MKVRKVSTDGQAEDDSLLRLHGDLAENVENVSSVGRQNADVGLAWGEGLPVQGTAEITGSCYSTGTLPGR